MKKKQKTLFNLFKFIFTVLGLALFSFLVYRTGFDTITSNITLIGYSFIFLIILALVWHYINSLAWYLLLHSSGLKAGFITVFFNKWAAESLNVILPMGNMGGEAFRVIMLSNNLKKENSLSNIIHDRLLHYVGSFFFICAGSLYGIVTLKNLDIKIKTFLIAFLALLFLIFILVKKFLKKGLNKYKFNSIQKYLDAISNDLFDYEHKTEIIVILLNVLGRVIGTVEIYLVLQFLGNPFSFGTCLLLSSFLILLNVVFFIIPGGIGIAEGGQVAFITWLNFSPGLGMSLAIIRRIRQLIMTALGIIIVPFLPELSQKKLPVKRKIEELN